MNKYALQRPRGPSRLRQNVVGWAIGVGCAVIVLWPFIAKGTSAPGFFHDWTWSLWADETRNTWPRMLSSWLDESIGWPNSVPTLNPLAGLKIALAWIFPGAASQNVYLFLSLVAAVAGVYRICAINARISPPWATLAAFGFGTSGFMFAKIASGQSSYWAATAAFVWGLSLFVEAGYTGDWRATMKAGLLFALATVQLQFVAFDAVAIAVVLASHPSRRIFLCSLLAAAMSLMLAFPALLLLAQHGPLAGADISRPYLYWEASQSSNIAEALAFFGYAARYPERALHALGSSWLNTERLASQLVALLAVLGCLFSTAEIRFRVALGVLGAVGLVWISGTAGPGAYLWELLFGNLAFAGFMREFFHAAVLFAVPVYVLCTLALQRLLSPTGIWGYSFTAVLFGLAGLASITGGYARVLPFVNAGDFTSALRPVSATPPSRSLIFPIKRPLSVVNDDLGGNDNAWIDRAHVSLYRYYLPPIVALASDAVIEREGRTAMGLLRRLHVGSIVSRQNVRSVRPAARISAFPDVTSVPSAFTTLTTGPMVEVASACEALPPDLRNMSSNKTITYLDIPGVNPASHLLASPYVPDPKNGWVLAREAYSAYEPLEAAPSYGVVVDRPGAGLRLTLGEVHTLLVWAPEGLMINGHLVKTRQFSRIYVSPRVADMKSLGLAAISEIGETGVSMHVSSARIKVSEVAPWSYRGSVSLHGRAVVVLRQAWDPGWTFSAKGVAVVRHLRADGYANAWVIEGNGSHAFSLEYSRQTTITLLLALSGALFAIFAVSLSISKDNIGTLLHLKGV